MQDGSGDFNSGTNTDSNGTYSLLVLPNDTYIVKFNDYTGAHVEGCYSDGALGHFTTDRNACRMVPVGTEDVGSIDVQMPLTP